ncbi:GalA Alpha-galactosidase [Fimbriimonadaceae bacterium]
MRPHLTNQQWTISSGEFKLLFGTDEQGRLTQRSIGAFSDAGEELKPAFPFAGNGWVFEPAFRVVHADGNTSSDLRLKDVAQSEKHARFTLEDEVYPLNVELHFLSHPELNIIESWTQVVHREPRAIRLEIIASSSLDLGSSELHLTQFSGDWANEANMIEEKLTPGIKILDSKLGVRSHQFCAPWFLVSQGKLVEDAGCVLAGSLAWSGSFKFSFEKLPGGSTRAIAGFNPFGSTYLLESGEVFETPKMLWAYGSDGAGGVSQRLHTFVRENVLRDGNRIRKILLNNWEATYFDFDETKIVSLFQGAKDLGMELFLLDDGWFGNKFPRDGDHQGLGDWVADPAKLPNGIGGLTSKSRETGLKFGLWFEPEMVNPKSQLFEAHPEWAIRQPHRELELQRNQLTLDLSNPEVRDFTFEVLHTTLSDNPDICYVKWDCNRYLTQPGSTYLSVEKQSHLQIEYTRGLYQLMERVVTAHPDVEIMMCSGGGGRIDYGALRFAHEVWPSDMTDPVRRIFIQWGFSYFIPAIAMAAHVTRWGERPLKFCFDVAMSGRLGLDVDINSFSQEDRDFATKAIARYKEIRETVQFGAFHRLESPYESSRSALMFTNQGRAVVFAYSIAGHATSPLLLKGLCPSQTYLIKEINLPADDRSLGAFTGAQLMSFGLPLAEMSEFGSGIFVLVS